MEYKKKYEQALERAREELGSGSFDRGTIEYIFPELKESEDERIGKALIKYFSEGREYLSLIPYNKEECVSWLEKQVTPQVRTGIEWVNTIDDACDKRYSEEYAHGEYCHEQSFKWGFQEGVDWLEKQGEQKPVIEMKSAEESLGIDSDTYNEIIDECIYGEQKPTDKVEPKFNIGDIIFNKKTKEQFTITDRSLALQYYHDEDHLHEVRSTEQDEWEIIKPKFHEGDWVYIEEVDGYKQGPFQIKEITQYGYTFFDRRSVIPFECESLMTPWTIQDAKDGDVLVNDEGRPFILKGLLDAKHPNCPVVYGGVCINCYDVEEFCISERYHWWCDSIGVKPATKEQRDTLMKAMKDARYTFDFEKKKLKKIEENEVGIPFGAKDSELQEVTYYIPKGFHAEIDDDKVVIKKGEKSTAWSEEDTETLNGIVNYLFTSTDVSSIEGSDKWYDWLKSLKDRVQPKQEWDEENERIYKSITYSFANNYPLTIQQQEFVKSLRPQKLCVYNPYKAVIESIAKMCDKYKNRMSDEEEAKDFLANVAVKCREAAEYDKQYMEE